MSPAAATLVLVAAGAAAQSGSVAPSAPAGFRLETFARDLSHPTAMAYGPDGRIYVTETDGNLVSIARGTKKPRVLLRGLRSPLGLAWRGRTLFVSEEGRLERARLSQGRLVRRKVLVSGLPFGAPAGQPRLRARRPALPGQRLDLRRLPRARSA